MDELLEKHNDKIFTNWEQSLETYYDMKDFYKQHVVESNHRNFEDIHLYHAQRSFLTEIEFNIINLVDFYFNESIELPRGFDDFEFDHRKHWFSLGGKSGLDRKSTRLNSSHVAISYAVFCLKKKKND